MKALVVSPLALNINSSYIVGTMRDETQTRESKMTAATMTTREERGTTRLGPARIRVGYREDSNSNRRTYFEMEAPKGWHVREMRPGAYTFTTSFGKDEDGKVVRGQLIHLFDEATNPVVIIDWENHYGERIDAERMTLAEYLNQEGA